ncbi:MAG: TetR/AcrR family transcriptional regulator [Chloroflexi bacterium]|nr:TetR/AcrR family transcriptional regulator [Chloroflexota bacterium]
MVSNSAMPEKIRVTPAELRKVASRLFKERGYHGTSMQDLADAVGLYKGSLYHHIPSKEHLLFLIVSSALEQTSASLASICALEASPLEKLRAAISHHVRYSVSSQNDLSVLLEDTKHLSQDFRRQIVAQQHRYEQLLGAILEEGMEKGVFRRTNVRMATFSILGICNWIYRWYSPDGPLNPEEIGEFFFDFVCRGLIQDVSAEKG